MTVTVSRRLPLHIICKLFASYLHIRNDFVWGLHLIKNGGFDKNEARTSLMTSIVFWSEAYSFLWVVVYMVLIHPTGILSGKSEVGQSNTWKEQSDSIFTANFKLLLIGSSECNPVCSFLWVFLNVVQLFKSRLTLIQDITYPLCCKTENYNHYIESGQLAQSWFYP